MVERWKMDPRGGAITDPDGEYYHKDDYQRLEAQREQLEADLEWAKYTSGDNDFCRLEAENKSLIARIEKLEGDVKTARKIIDAKDKLLVAYKLWTRVREEGTRDE